MNGNGEYLGACELAVYVRKCPQMTSLLQYVHLWHGRGKAGMGLNSGSVYIAPPEQSS